LSLQQQDSTVAYLLPRPAGLVPCEHSVHFYDADESLVRLVASFVCDGLEAGESVVAVATAAHLRELERALAREDCQTKEARQDGRLTLLRADETLDRFMVGGLPDASRFREVIDAVIARAAAVSPTGRLRVYGEMVDVLWQEGSAAATIQLEQLWNELVRARPLALMCGYRLEGFPGHEDTQVFRAICAHHGAVAPTERFTALRTSEERLARVAELEQRAAALEAEIAQRARLEAERARLYDGERAARAELAHLHRLTAAANRADTLDEAYAAALDGIGSALGVDRASILLFDSDGVMRFKAWRGLSDAYRAAVEGHSPWRAGDARPSPVIVEDVREAEALVHLAGTFEREGIGALAFFPLCHGGRLRGKFMVYHHEVHAFTDAEVRIATAIADEVACAVDRKLAALERERMLGIVGHDLRNPLNAVTMAAGMLLRQELPEGVERSVRRISTSATRMERLISQLLLFAQARHAGGVPVNRTACELGELARRVVDELLAARPEREVAIERAGELSGTWDPDRLDEVLSNLVGNALQHGAEGPVTVRLRGEGAEVVIEVHNGGVAIPAATLPHVFDPFRRGDGAGGERSHSVGLGLFISREIARAHGGSIAVASSEGEGTTFVVRLPRGG
jgi:signal transduction histidine kinase/uncharacterized small protein (DUF1192 family)